MTRAVDGLQGVHCPIVTPFVEGEVDHASLRAAVAHVLDGGIDGIVPCGTTGEFASLTDAERRAVIETTVEAVDGRGPVIAGAAGTAVPTVCERIEQAAAAGADAILLPNAYFHPANDDAGERRFLERIADASPLPIVLYNIPVCTGRPIPVDVVEALAAHEAVVGIKDSSGDLNYLSEIIRRTGSSFTVLQGFDSLLAPAILSGADGGINALSGIRPEAFASLYRTATDGSIEGAFEPQRSVISPIFQACLEDGFAPVVKAMLADEGIIESAAVRPPLVAVEPPTLET